MDFSGYTPFPDKELGGLANYDDASQIPMGLANIVKNMRFRRKSVRSRDGYLHTMAFTDAVDTPSHFTGVDAIDVLVNNPRQVVAACTSAGILLQELPVGSRNMVALPTPFLIGQWTITAVTGANLGGTSFLVELQLGGVSMPAVGASVAISNLVAASFLNGLTFVVNEVVNNLAIGIVVSGHASYGTALDSGTLRPSSPINGASMQTAKAYNRIHMAFSDLTNALTPPLVLDGPTGVVAPISQNPTGAIWTPGRNYLTGDAVRTSNNPNRWFRCIVPGIGGASEPNWPALDGYLVNTSHPSASILSAFQLVANLAVFTVSNSAGMSVGDSITVTGVSNPFFNGTWVISAVGTNTISATIPSIVQHEGTGGTLTDTSSGSPTTISAQITDPNGTSQWVEWTPALIQFVPQPEPPAQILSVKGQAGAPAGSISASQDVYVCFAYQNANGESIWTAPIVFTNTASSDVLEVFFQKQNEVPGPTVPAVFGAAGYGGPRMPEWMISVLGLADPKVSWPGLTSLNVYIAAVATGTDAPQTFYQYLSGAPVYQPVVITSIPSTVAATTFIQRIQPTASLSTIPFVGSGGPRYFAVARQDLNESLVPIDPGSPLLVNLTSSIAASGTANVLFIQRDTNGIVTCTVDLLAGFSQGAEVIIAGVTDTTFNGSFTLTGVSPNQFGGATLLWSQVSSPQPPAGSSTGGTAISASAATAFIVPQILIATIVRATNVVTAVVNSLQGIDVGSVISVTGVTDVTFNGTPFTITSIIPDLGGGGTLTWNQTVSNASSTGGNISPTGAATGNNAAQNVGFIVRNEYPAFTGIVLAVVFDPSGKATEPPPGFQAGAVIVVAGMSDSSLDGTFMVRSSSGNPGKGGGYAVAWNQAGGNVKINGPAGTITLTSGAQLHQSRGNISAIARATNVVTATLDTVANFAIGAQVQVAGVIDTSFDGVFQINSVNSGSSQIQWTQIGPNGSSSAGVAAETSGGSQQPAPVAILPPGGPFISEDILALTVQGGSQLGPFTFIPEQDPVTAFTAQIIAIGAVNGAVTALLSDTSGIQPGNTIQIKDTTNDWFDGVFVLAEVNGNTVEWAGVGPGTGFSGGTLSLIPTQPSVAMGQNNPVAITIMARTASGVVTAQVTDVSNLEPGMRISVAGSSDATFTELVVVLSVSQNQLPGSTTPLAGAATWQSATISSSTATGGFLQGIPGIIFDAIDNDLANADDVTPQLSSLGAPSCVDVFFSEQLNMMVYTIGQDSSHYFSNPGDPANIALPGGILGVAESNGERTRGFREMISGEMLSMKEKSGYEITPGSSTMSQAGVSRRWSGHGPCSARAMDTADSFLIYFDEDSGPYRYHNGESMQIGQELQGTWDRLNKDASQQVCVCIDNVRKEIHFALPLDNSFVPNHDIVLNYFNGWNEPLMMTMTGEMVPDPHGRRWADNDIATLGGNARLIKVLKRTLINPPDIRIAKRQVTFCLASADNTNTSYIDMNVPDQFNDNTQPIDNQYQPAFAQSPTCEVLEWDKSKGRVLGNGQFSIQPLTEKPDSDLAPVFIDISNGLPDSFEKGFGTTKNELFALLYSNHDQTGNPIANSWFEIHRSVRYGKVRTSGTPR